MFVPAASATTSNLSGNSATISSVCVPIDPVLPRRENLCDETIRGQFASQRGTLHKTNRYPERGRTFGVVLASISGGTTR